VERIIEAEPILQPGWILSEAQDGSSNRKPIPAPFDAIHGRSKMSVREGDRIWSLQRFAKRRANLLFCP
jgi:hypothetical protein